MAEFHLAASVSGVIVQTGSLSRLTGTLGDIAHVVSDTCAWKWKWKWELGYVSNVITDACVFPDMTCQNGCGKKKGKKGIFFEIRLWWNDHIVLIVFQLLLNSAQIIKYKQIGHIYEAGTVCLSLVIFMAVY